MLLTTTRWCLVQHVVNNLLAGGIAMCQIDISHDMLNPMWKWPCGNPYIYNQNRNISLTFFGLSVVNVCVVSDRQLQILST